MIATVGFLKEDDTARADAGTSGVKHVVGIGRVGTADDGEPAAGAARVDAGPGTTAETMEKEVPTGADKAELDGMEGNCATEGC